MVHAAALGSIREASGSVRAARTQSAKEEQESSKSSKERFQGARTRARRDSDEGESHDLYPRDEGRALESTRRAITSLDSGY